MPPAYLGIVRELSDRIASGDLRTGDRVPSTRQIAAAWGVAIATATKALAELQRRGLVRAVPGVGTVVSDGSSPTMPSQPPISMAAASPMRSATAGPQPPVAAPSRRPSGVRAAIEMRDRIVATAIRIADAEGINAVSMRRIGVELGVPTMSLYRWIPSRDDLTLHMIDATLGQARWPDTPPPGWRAQLEYAAHAQWAITSAHPWLAQMLSMTRPQLAPNAMMHTEWIMRAVTEAGLSAAEGLQVALTIVGFGVGTASAVDNERQAERETGITSDEWMATQEAKAQAIFATGRYPTIASLNDEDVDGGLDAMFEVGLGIILDGIEQLIARKRAAHVASAAKRRKTGASAATNAPVRTAARAR